MSAESGGTSAALLRSIGGRTISLIILLLLSLATTTTTATDPQNSSSNATSTERPPFDAHEAVTTATGSPDVEPVDSTADSESRLHHVLFDGYAKDARPAAVTNVSLHVQLISLDEVNSAGSVTLTLQIWMTWRDRRFRWSPDAYTGVVSLQVLPVDRIWFPLFWIRNSAQPDIQSSFWTSFPAFVGWTGLVSWVSSGKVTVACDLDFYYYPSDTQRCSLQFAAHDTYHVNLTARDDRKPVCFDRYTNNSLWEITGTRAVSSGISVRRTVEYLNIELRLRRRPLTDVLRIFVPTASLAIVSLIAFALPADSGDKLNVTFTTMLAFFVLFLAITDMVPFTADHTPVMTYFIVVTLLLSTLETIMCTIIITISDIEKHRHEKEKDRRKRQDRAATIAAVQQAQQHQQPLPPFYIDSEARMRAYSIAESAVTVSSGISSVEGRRQSFDSLPPQVVIPADTAVPVLEDAAAAAATYQSDTKTRQQQQQNTWRYRLGMLLVRHFLMRRGLDPSSYSSMHPCCLLICSSKVLNVLCFIIFSVVKAILISGVSTTLYSKSYEIVSGDDDFELPEYVDCWR